MQSTFPENAQWQRDLAVSQWRLAGHTNSGVSWTDVVTTFDAIATSVLEH